MLSEFEKAVEFVRKPVDGHSPSTAQKLRFYGLYKQATVGDNETPEPSFYQLEAKQKWKAWADFKGMDKEAAQQEYIKELDKSTPNWREHTQ
ncbi:acyl-CoA-binding protein 2 [Cyclospora cayetanensis]|uniref:Acyl-CoA-binding protein 2 n=2 Tax=Cyclospora cayetanensis TaxID=88456 RepID=A0A6P5WCC0_9EIME|nr:acyl-CoA-binding protein 2 [Cyclospora cayetanensis]OEH74059.1 acyl-CoA-binding protein [Cyclospora cayetanensis]